MLVLGNSAVPDLVFLSTNQEIVLDDLITKVFLSEILVL